MRSPFTPSLPLSPGYPEEAPSPAVAPVSARAWEGYLRVREVVLVTECQQLWVECSPSLHLFLDSTLRQMEAMEPYTRPTRSSRTPSAAGLDEPDAPGAGSPAHSAGAGVREQVGFRPRAMSDPPLPPPVQPLAVKHPLAYAGKRSPVPLPPLITHLHCQLTLSTFGFRVRMPDTGSLVLSTAVLALSVSHYIPCLVSEPAGAAAAGGRDRRPGTGRPGKARRPRPAAGEHRTGSLRRPVEEKKGEEKERGSEDAGGHMVGDRPVTSVLLRVEGLDCRLLDAESCDLPLAALVADDGKAGGGGAAIRKGKESVLTSLIAKKCIVSGCYTADSSPITSHPSVPPRPVPHPSRGPAMGVAQGPRHGKRSIFVSRQGSGQVAGQAASASLAVLVSCEESVLTLPFYELESLYFSDYLGPWRPTIEMLSVGSKGAGSGEVAALQPAPWLPTRVTCQLVSVSLAMLPLPSVMITYHIDRMWLKVDRSTDQDVLLMLSIGAHNRATGAAEASDDLHREPSPSSASGAFRPGEASVLPVNSHKITLHSANARKRKPRREEHVGPGEDGGHHTRRATAFQGASMASVGTLASSQYGGLGAVLYSRMQFVLDFALPTLRASLTVGKDEEAGGWRVGEDERKERTGDAQLDPVVAAALMRLSSEQMREEDGESDSDSSPSSSHSTDDDSPSSHTRPRPDSLHLTAEAAARIRLVEGVIAVGGMSNALNENVLNRLLHLQSTLNAELNQLIEKAAHYSQTMAASQTAATPGPHPPPLADEGGVWQRYCFNVSVVFTDIHLTAGLDANKKTHRNRRSLSHPYGAGGGFDGDAVLSPSAPAVYFDSTWDPVVEVKTGVVSLAVRYTPRLYRLYRQQRREAQRRHARRTSAFSLPWEAAPDADPLTLLSDVVVELNCYGAGIEVSTSGRERYDAYTLLMSHAARRALVQLASHIQLKLGLDADSAHLHVELHLRESLMKVTAIPPLIGSAHALTDRYYAAYQHYQAEAAKLKAEEDFHDPLQALRATGVWSLRQPNPPSPPLSPPSSEASAPLPAPHVSLHPNAGSLARLLSLLDSLSPRTHHHLRLTMERSEIVCLFERPRDPPPPAAPAPPAKRRAPHSWGEVGGDVGGSLPPSPGRSLMSGTPTPMARGSEDGGFFLPAWQLGRRGGGKDSGGGGGGGDVRHRPLPRPLPPTDGLPTRAGGAGGRGRPLLPLPLRPLPPVVRSPPGQLPPRRPHRRGARARLPHRPPGDQRPPPPRTAAAPLQGGGHPSPPSPPTSLYRRLQGRQPTEHSGHTPGSCRGRWGGAGVSLQPPPHPLLSPHHAVLPTRPACGLSRVTGRGRGGAEGEGG